jgi:aspartyl-tRNA(Asn)/glutamyl-tRNA(Gln) amidotransferase subunit A
MTQRKYADFMRAVAEFRGYPFQDRAEQWEARIAFNAPDMETLFHAAAEGDPVLLPPRAAVRASPPPAAPAAPPAKGALESASIAQIAAQVTGRKLAPVDIARHFLDRIQAQQALNAFITVDPAQVLAQAEQLGQRVARGENIGPLAGVPVAVKDLMSVQGYPLSGGTRSIDPLVQTADAPVVARLRAAGALIVGTANLHELAFGVTSANPHFGTVQNPRFPQHWGGDRHWRLHPAARVLLRHRGFQTQLRRRAARRRDSSGLDPGSHRPPVPHGGGHRQCFRGHGGPRPWQHADRRRPCAQDRQAGQFLL